MVQETGLNNGGDDRFNSLILEWSDDCNGDGLVDYGPDSLKDSTAITGWKTQTGVPDICEPSCDLSSPPTQGAIQWSEGSFHWYSLVISEAPISWEEAKWRAEDLGGHLATLTSSEEAEFVYANLGSQEEAWYFPVVSFGRGPAFGGRRQDPLDNNSPFEWVTGETWDYTNWGSGQPNAPYLHFGSASFTIEPSASWYAFENDPDPAQTFTSFIVEWSVEDCDENGINDACESDLDADGTIDACDDEMTMATIFPTNATPIHLLVPLQTKPSNGCRRGWRNGHWYMGVAAPGQPRRPIGTQPNCWVLICPRLLLKKKNHGGFVDSALRDEVWKHRFHHWWVPRSQISFVFGARWWLGWSGE